MCWYWKINKFVALREKEIKLQAERNKLILSLVQHFCPGALTDTEIKPENVPEPVTYEYIVEKETALHDSLSRNPKTIRMLKADEEANILNTIDREDLGGTWARIHTMSGDDEGWCLLSCLRKKP
jgi:hypothetical protein